MRLENRAGQRSRLERGVRSGRELSAPRDRALGGGLPRWASRGGRWYCGGAARDGSDRGADCERSAGLATPDVIDLVRATGAVSKRDGKVCERSGARGAVVTGRASLRVGIARVRIGMLPDEIAGASAALAGARRSVE